MAIVAQNRIGAHLGIPFRLISRLWRRELAKDLLQRLIIEVVGGPNRGLAAAWSCLLRGQITSVR